MANADHQGNAADRLAAATPATRDRYVDLIRAVSILVVVFGHWTMAAFSMTEQGNLRVDNVLSYATHLQPLTWIAQVMPLFFIAAGFTNARSLRNRNRRVPTFLAGRLSRVTTPALVFIGIWLITSPILVAAGVPEQLVRVAGQNSAMVLWFLAVYLLLAALAPAQLALYRRSPLLLLLAAPLLATGLDQLQNTAWAGFGFVNYLLIFAFCQQLGFLYADGRLVEVGTPVWVLTALGAAGALIALTALGPYPVSMIGLPGQDMSNMLPPSVCVIAVAVLQLGIAMAVRPALAPLLQRRRFWFVVAAVNRSVMTIFLWHLTAITMVTGIVLLAGWTLVEPGTGTWWWHKVLWLAAASAVTLIIVALLSPIETRMSGTGSSHAVGWSSAAGIVLVALGMTMIASAGFADPFTRGGVALAGLTFAPAWGAAAVVAGYLLCRRQRSPQVRRTTLPG